MIGAAMSMLRSLVSLCLLPLAVAGCTNYPYPTTAPKDLTSEIDEIYLERKLQEGRESDLVRPGIVSLCYGPAIDDRGELYDSALRQCSGDYQRLIYYGRDTLGAPCAVVQPYRHTFLCVDLQARTVIPPIPNQGETQPPQTPTPW
jgi:hypothetical protein